MCRKRIAMLLMALVLLCLTACVATSDETEQKPPKIGVCFRQESAPGTAACRQLLEAALTEKGYQVLIADGKNDQTKQNAQLQDMLDQGCELLIVEPVMLDEAESVVELLRQADVPGVLINREPDAEVLESWDRICFVGRDASQPGLMQGQIILGQPDRGDINGDGVVTCIVIAGPEDHIDANLRSEYCAKELTFAGVETNLIARFSGDWSRESGRQLCAQALSAYGMDIEVVFCNNDAMALGAMEAIRSSGWVAGKDMYLVGIGAEKDALDAVRQGSLTGTVLWDVQGQVDKVLEAAQLLMAGEPVQRKYYVDYVKVAAQNVEAMLQQDK